MQVVFCVSFFFLLIKFPKKYLQTVPKYSAVKINGKKLYEYARENIEIELPKFQLRLMAPIVDTVLPKAKVEKKVQTIYGVRVVKNVNQTCIWIILKKVCDNKDEEGTKIARQLYSEQPEVFLGAVRCLISKKRINYINSIIEA